jgi:hypothetical protein
MTIPIIRIAEESGKQLDLVCSPPVFMLAIAFDWIAGVLAFVVLKPLRIRWLSALSDTKSHPQQHSLLHIKV